MSISRSDRKFQEHQRSVERNLNRQIVRIVNPHAGGKTHLKLTVAMAHVAAGRAEFRCNGTAIEFLGHQYLSALKSIEADREVHRTMGTPDQRIPVVRMRELFAPSPRRNFAWEKATMKLGDHPQLIRQAQRKAAAERWNSR